jgi:tetratricopeptide (TPR) repeat protein
VIIPGPLTISLRILLFLAVALAGAAAPSDAGLLSKIQQLIRQGDLAGARERLNTALRQEPQEPALYNLLGVVDAQQGNYSAAEVDFKRAIDRAPGFEGALLNLGRLYLENSSKDAQALRKALDTYQRVLRYQPGNVEALYQSALLLALQGAFRESLKHLDRMPADEQARPQALAVGCADYSGLGDSLSAAKVAERLLRDPAFSEADVLPLLPVFESRDVALAAKLIEGLAAKNRASPATVGRLGALYEHEGKLVQARELLEKTAQAGAPSVSLLSELARVAYQQHDWEGALGYLAHARDLEPNNASIHFFFGIVSVELNLPLEARKSLEQAVRLNPGNPYYNYALGSVVVQGRNPGEAVPYFQKYIESKPDDPRGRFALGAAYFYAGNYETARKQLEGVANRSETAAGAHYFLGRIAKQEDNLAEAERELQQAVAANSNFSDGLSELAHVHIRMQNYAAAGTELTRALQMEPENFRANANLLILYQKTKDPRAGEQQVKFEEIKKKRSENEQLLWRSIEVRPY